MRKQLSLFLMAVSIATSAQTVTVTGVFDYNEAKAFVRAVNMARAKKKINTLKMEQGLTEAAMLRAAELSTQWSLFVKDSMRDENIARPNGKKFGTLVTEKYTMPQGTECGELFICCLANKDLISSRKEYLSDEKFVLKSWKAVGAAVFYRNGQTFCVMLFAEHSNGNSEIPSGLWNSKVQVGTDKSRTSTFLSKEQTNDYKYLQKVDISATFYYDFATEVVRLVNIRRDSFGLAPLTMDPALTEWAMVRAAEMASTRSIGLKKWYNSSMKGYTETHLIGHRRPNGSNALTILSEEHKNADVRGENAAGGQTTPENVVVGWMRSPGHRANILHKSYKSIGVGVCCYFGSFCWIQLFTSHKNPTTYHPNSHEEVTVQISLNPAVESKVVKRSK